MKLTVAVFVLGTLVLVTSSHAGTPSYKFDPTGQNVVELSGLSDKEDCQGARITGRIVKRSFDRNGLNIESVVVEGAKGDRTFINAGDNRGNDAATIGLVKRGLETLLREGGRVILGVWACGAAGRVLNLHSVRAAR